MPTSRDDAQFPWLDDFFHDDLPALPRSNPKVYSLFLEYASVPESERSRVLNPGFESLVRIMPNGQYGFTPPIGEDIHLGKTFVEEFESALGPFRSRRERVRYAPTEKEGNLFRLMEAVVLHELVHYFRRKYTDAAKLNTTHTSAYGRI